MVARTVDTREDAIQIILSFANFITSCFFNGLLVGTFLNSAQTSLLMMYFQGHLLAIEFLHN